MKKTSRSDSCARRTLFSGAATIGVSVMVVKIIGLLYKIPLMDVIGAQGMGYFNSAYEVYLVFCIIATAGIPVAMSAIISEYRAEGDVERAEQLYTKAMRALVPIGALGFAVMLLGADALAHLIGNSCASACIAALSPSVVLIFMTGILRGYFQGFGDMTPTAVSQVIEAAGKLGLGLLLSTLAVRRGADIPTASAFAVLGLTAGSAISVMYLLLVKRSRSMKRKTAGLQLRHSDKNGLGRLLRSAVPITLSAVLAGATGLLDTWLILRGLQSVGFSEALANSIFGSYTTLVLPVFNLVPSLVTGVALSTVPMLTEAIKRHERESEEALLRSSLKLGAIIAMPSSFGLAAFSRQLLELVFSRHAEAVEMCAPLLSALSASVLLSCLITVTNAALQAYGKAHLPMISMLAGAAVKLIVGYILIGYTGIGVLGAPLSTLACNTTILLLNFAFIGRYSAGIRGSAALITVLMLASVVSVSLAMAVYAVMIGFCNVGILATCASVAVAAVVYFVIIARMRVLEPSELSALPILNRFAGSDKKRRKRNFKESINENR